MGILDFVKQGTRELMIARPDNLKHLIIYKHPDQTIPFWSQLTVDSDEGAVFFKDGQVQGVLGPGRHTLSTQNIPFLSNIVDKYTGGNVFIAEVFFVRSQPIREVPFGGSIGMMEDPMTMIMCEPRIFGEFAVQVIDPVKFVVGYTQQAAQARDNEEILRWVSNLFLDSISEVIGETCETQQLSVVQISTKRRTLADRFMRSVPAFDHIGLRIVEMGRFKISFSKEEEQEMKEKWRDFRSDLKKAHIDAQKRQAGLDQEFQQDARYANLAGQNPGYMMAAQADAIRGAGEGMAKGGASTGVAQMGAQMAMGVGMAGMFNQGMQGMYGMPQAPVQRVQAPPGGAIQCGRCGAQNAGGKFCASCGTPLAAPQPQPQGGFCSGCGSPVAGKFCANCGTPFSGAGGPPPGGGQPPPGGGYQPPGGYPQQGGYTQGGYPPAPQPGGYPQAPPGGYQQPPGGQHGPQGGQGQG